MVAMCMIAAMGCASLPGVVADRSELAGIVAAWRAAGMPWTARCASEQHEVRLLELDGAAFQAECWYPQCPQAGDCADSCMVYEHGGLMDTSVAPTIVVGSRTNLPGHRAHEALHWLSECATGSPDAGHSNAAVWGRPNGLLGRLGG